MSSETIIVVAGFGRCGSSLLMRMLHAGGVQVYCDSHLFYETTKALELPENWEWLNDVKGKAVKILNLHEKKLRHGLDYKIIWLDRDRIQQAKSALTFSDKTERILLSDSASVPELAKIYDKDMIAVNRYLNELNAPVLRLKFEELISAPLPSAMVVGEFLEMQLNTELMVASVKPRDSDCLPYMMEYDQLIPNVEGIKIIIQ
jgi:hypothetical protein